MNLDPVFELRWCLRPTVHIGGLVRYQVGGCKERNREKANPTGNPSGPIVCVIHAPQDNEFGMHLEKVSRLLSA